MLQCERVKSIELTVGHLQSLTLDMLITSRKGARLQCAAQV